MHGVQRRVLDGGSRGGLGAQLYAAYEAGDSAEFHRLRRAIGGTRGGAGQTGSPALMRAMVECRQLMASALLDAADAKQDAIERFARRQAERRALDAWFDDDEFDECSEVGWMNTY